MNKFGKSHRKQNIFGSLFGGGGGSNDAIVHNGGGARTTSLPAADPRQQLQSGGQGTGGDPKQQQQPANPLDSHLEAMGKVWDTATTADGKPVGPTPDPLATPLFNFKPEDVQKGFGQLNFLQGVNPELPGKALAGDADALVELINIAVRNGAIGTTINTGKLLNDGFSRHGQQIDAALPQRLRSHAIQTSQSTDPILSHKSVAPVVNAMKLTIAQNNPSFTPEQVQQAAETYVKGLGGAFGLAEKKVTTETQDAEGQDWFKLMNLG